MKNFLLYLIFGLSVAISGCNSSRALTKDAAKLEAAGLTADAAEKYYKALRKKNTNIDAKIGLREAGQFVLNEKLSSFIQSKTFGNKKEALDQFHDAQDYFTKVKNIGVDLQFPSQYYTDYEDVKNAHLDDLYAIATGYLEQEKYEAANYEFRRITALDPNFKDAQMLQSIAFAEPLYKDGVHALANNEYRTALTKFSSITNYLPNYKDAKDLESVAVEEGVFPIAILSFENGTTTSGVEATAGAYALIGLSDVDDPFVKVVDRENMQLMLNEQQMGLSGIFDEQTALNVGEITGAKAILTGTVLNYTVDNGEFYPTTKNGYEKFKVKKVNSETGVVSYVTKYKKVKYKEHFGTRKVDISIQFKMVSLTTGEILFTDIYKKEFNDEVNYVVYKNGKVENLYPSKSDGVNTSSYAYKALQKKITERKKLKSEAELATAIYEDEARFVKSKIERILKQVIN